MDCRIGKGLLIGAAVLAAGSSVALAQGPRMTTTNPPRKIRPDVIVSGVGSTFTKYGTVGTITGYAVTTVSCNITTTTGDDAIWIDDTNPANPLRNQHPVISQQVYRMKNGRFEEIGMSWLKHGWCAADAPNCGSPYMPNGSCDWLGRFATDTYGADLNADQTDLGPRSEVNGWTGQFPYPYLLNWNLTGNAIYKRLQIQNDDLNPNLNPNSLYFAEVTYTPADEWPEQRFNNGSWRRFTVGALQTYFFTTTGCDTSNGPVQWTLLAGHIPTGMTGPFFQGQDAGAVSGRPTVTGTYSFMVQVTDSVGATAAQTFTITVV